jgi:hypothetical protein
LRYHRATLPRRLTFARKPPLEMWSAKERG